jgi:hypothetical protein
MLVQARLGMIEPHLRDMTLKALGDIRMIHDYFGTHDLKRDEPEVTGGKFSLATRGIFPNDDSWAGVASVEHDRGGGLSAIATTHRLWGLTRDGEWIAIKVYSTIGQEPYKYKGRTEQVQRVKTVKIEPSTLAEVCVFCKRSPQDIWKRLGEIIKKWADHRKNLYEDAKDLEEEVLREEVLLELVLKK